MRNRIYIHVAVASLFIGSLTGIAAAQGSEGDTSISYDDSTGLVTVYGETTNALDTDYATQMSIVVKDQNGTTVASGNDYQLWNDASVSLEFQGNPGSVYTATTNHCVRLQSWSYDNEFPYHQFYYDYWYMSSFLSQSINWPLYYWFASPGWQEVHRTTNVICMGKTYSTVEVPPTVTITKADGTALPNPFRIGINGGGHDRAQHLKAIVSPASRTSGVSIGASSKITKSNVNSASGVITFDVVGNAASSTAGDSSITAVYSSKTVVTKPVSVVVPSKIATPHDTDGVYSPSNRVLDGTTSPAAHGVASGNVLLVTLYCRYLNIVVKDQFNELIGDVYAGAEITETRNGQTLSANQFLSSHSSYGDYVGTFTEWGLALADSPTAQAWPNQPLLPVASSSGTQNIPVQVDGFSLNPAVAGRVWTATAPSTVIVSWPN
jgi:hypothetical protein